MKNNTGITLIALVITIIVLLILAGVSINMITGDDGLLIKATDASEKTKLEQEEEREKLGEVPNYIDEQVSGSKNNSGGNDEPEDEVPESTVTLVGGSGWYKGITAKSTIKKVKFTNSYTVTGNETESWSASIDENGEETDDYKCYITGTELTIVGNNKIIANEDCSNLFANFTALTEIENLGMLNTSKATDMSQMFANCYYLTSLDVSGFNTSNVANMYCMFYQCMRITEFIGIENFDTSNVLNMSGMFFVFGWYDANDGGSHFPILDISNFNIEKVETLECMFMGSTALETIYVSSDWNTTGKNTTDMFNQCGTNKVTVK